MDRPQRSELWNPVERDCCRTHEAGLEGGVQRPSDPGTKRHLDKTSISACAMIVPDK